MDSVYGFEPREPYAPMVVLCYVRSCEVYCLMLYVHVCYAILCIHETLFLAMLCSAVAYDVHCAIVCCFPATVYAILCYVI